MYFYKPWTLFWAAALSACIYLVFAFSQKWRLWLRGIPVDHPVHLRTGETAGIWFMETFLNRQLFGLSLFRWVTHIFIFWGFLGLAFLSFFMGAVRIISSLGWDIGTGHLLFSGSGYKLTKIWGDFFGLALLAGVLLAFFRRIFFRPLQVLNDQADAVLLIFLFWLALSGFILEGLRLKFIMPAMLRYSFVGRLFIPPGSYTIADLQSFLTAVWSLHAFSALGLMVYLPHSKLLHSIVAPFVIARNAAEEHDRKDLYWPDIQKYRPTR